ncbi:type I restriction endonuclease [Aeromonas caviae]|uniref:type I restriction endonuclease n=1 Tax=Aeromonas caviae TaxID=648 RepID=UPI002B470741|nr:type I restriction endonuclease [Aeromonas caviae]
MTEDQLKQEVLGGLAETGYLVVSGYDVAPDRDTPWRDNFSQVLLQDQLRGAIARFNPKVPLVASEDGLAPIMPRLKENLSQAKTLATLRDTLLPRLISGQLRLPGAEALIAEANLR